MLIDPSLSLPAIDLKWLLVGFSLQFFYRLLFFKYLGATIGKLIFGLRLVSQKNGEELTWYQVGIRVLADHLSIFVGKGFFSLALLRFDRTHLSDWLAETRVVQKHELPRPPERYLIWAVVACAYFSFTGFLSASHFLGHARIQDGQLVISKLWSRPASK